MVHRPNQRLTARTAAIVPRANSVPLADVFAASTIIEPAAVRLIASGRNRRALARTLRSLIAEEVAAIDDPEAFGQANAGSTSSWSQRPGIRR